MTQHLTRFLIFLILCLHFTSPAGAQIALDETARNLIRQEDEQLQWSRHYPPALGVLVGPVTADNRVWLAVGSQLYGYDLDGQVVARIHLPGEAAALDASGGEPRVTVRYGPVPETFTVAEGAIRERMVFPPLPETTRWLERASREGLNFDPLSPADPTAAIDALRQALIQDPTNPFTHAYLAFAALRARQVGIARQATDDALAQDVPFFVSVQLARYFDSVGLPQAADRALQNARQSWADLGYDPALPVSREALKAYGNPHGYLSSLLSKRNLVRAEAWIRFLRDIAPRFEGHRAVYDRYIHTLDAQNRVGEAYEWRTFTRRLARGSLYGLGPDALLAVRDVARWSAFTLIATLVATTLVLGARAWRTQGRDLAPLGGRYRSWVLHPLSRLRRVLLSYWGFGEKLALVVVLGALLVSLSVWAWSTRTYTRANAPVLNIGTYGGAWFYDGLERLGLEVTSPEARFVRGLSAQLDGDSGAAREYYGDVRDACAINNVGVLLDTRGDALEAREQYRRALALDPNLSAPAYNLRLNPGGFEALFQRTYRDTPRLCYPDAPTVYGAVAGELTGDLHQIGSDPWTYLMRFPGDLPRPVQWMWAALLLMTTAVSVLWLFVPRLHSARTDGRSVLYRLLSLLFPGVAFLDVAWGLVLLLTWAAAVVGGMGVLGWVRFPYLLDLRVGNAPTVMMAMLIGCYVLNLILVLVDEVRFARFERRARTVTTGRNQPQ